MRESALNWGYCCFVIPLSATYFAFEKIRESTLILFEPIGLTNVFRHFGGFLVFHFRDEIGVNNFLRNNPIVIANCVFKMKSWHEFFPDNLDNLGNEKFRIWVKFTRVPFIYWTVKGLCMLGSEVGDLIGMDKNMHEAAVRNEPIPEAWMFIEIGVLDPVKHFILVSAYADVGEEPLDFKLILEDSDDSGYCVRDHVPTSDSDGEDLLLENAEFHIDSELDYLVDWSTRDELGSSRSIGAGVFCSSSGRLEALLEDPLADTEVMDVDTSKTTQCIAKGTREISVEADIETSGVGAGGSKSQIQDKQGVVHVDLKRKRVDPLFDDFGDDEQVPGEVLVVDHTGSGIEYTDGRESAGVSAGAQQSGGLKWANSVKLDDEAVMPDSDI
ncbi:hypothetical protein POM88_021523 [Heracleum sosnowskyi]|uniref:DUF4283 domain-containing protein n=1 Tax=Heracleum sosnowskyi TaxID=360622 RepID=A0AAD8IG17_9APIA|nr:hypothetical protein POM88_021523 [Heracleum sosnowskyi]